MSKFLVLSFFIFSTILSAQAGNCEVRLNLGRELYPETLESEVRSQMVTALAKKGYTSSTSDEAEYTLKVNYGRMMTTTNCFVWAAGVQVINSGKQLIADEFAEASMFRLTFNKGSCLFATNYLASFGIFDSSTVTSISTRRFC